MQKWRVGDVTITKVVEMELVGMLERVLPELTPQATAPFSWLRPHYIDEHDRLKLSIHALLVQTPTRRIIVDTCFGNDKQGRAHEISNNLHGPFLQHLADAGFPRESIDTVLCTHLHVDHVGWNTMLVDRQWKPTFPNARYLLGRDEFEFWRTQTAIERQLPVFADSVKPVFDAGLVDLVAHDHCVCDEVSLVPTAGHSPGHVSVRISSCGEEALITGDTIHHPGQIALPHIASRADQDAAMATATRLRILEGLADRPTLLIGTHFTTPSAGRLVRDGDAYRLVAG